MKFWSRLKSTFRNPSGNSRVENQLDDEVRDHRAGVRMELFWQDACFGLCQLWKNPGFTLSVIAALALGISANTAIFSPWMR